MALGDAVDCGIGVRPVCIQFEIDGLTVVRDASDRIALSRSERHGLGRSSVGNVRLALISNGASIDGAGYVELLVEENRKDKRTVARDKACQDGARVIVSSIYIVVDRLIFLRDGRRRSSSAVIFDDVDYRARVRINTLDRVLGIVLGPPLGKERGVLIYHEGLSGSVRRSISASARVPSGKRIAPSLGSRRCRSRRS